MALIQVSGLVDIPAGASSGSVVVDAIPGYVRRMFGTTSGVYGDGATGSVTIASVAMTRTDGAQFRYAGYINGGSHTVISAPFSAAIERNPSGAQPQIAITAALAAPAPIGGVKARVGCSIETGCDADDKG